jgi:DNA repair exonuclease SbcCD ATPase subunit
MKNRPEWAGKAWAYINFELPAYEHMKSDEIRSTGEYRSFLEAFVKSVPKVEGVYPEGIKITTPLRTWSDDYSYSLAGVPAMRNDFQDSEFMKTHYHSQFDNKDTYNEKAFKFHHNLYGLLVMAYDERETLPLDFSDRMGRMKASVNPEIFKATGIDSIPLIAQIEKVEKLAKDKYSTMEALEKKYQGLKNKESNEAKDLLKSIKANNKQLLKIYKFAQDHFARLTWEDEEIFPHEHAQNNLDNLGKAITALKAGKQDEAIDEYLWKIDNMWYTYHFDKEVTDYFTNQVLKQSPDRLYWGAGRVMGRLDLYEPINQVFQQYGQKGKNFTKEIKAFEQAEVTQKALLTKTVQDEIQGLNTMAQMLEAVK